METDAAAITHGRVATGSTMISPHCQEPVFVGQLLFPQDAAPDTHPPMTPQRAAWLSVTAIPTTPDALVQTKLAPLS